MGGTWKTEQIIEALKANNGLVYRAAKALGCTPKTIYNRAKRVQAVRDTIDNARGELVDIAEMALRSSVVNKEPWAVALVLKTLGKNRGYVERQEVTGQDGGPIKGSIDDDSARRIADYIATGIKASGGAGPAGVGDLLPPHSG